MMRSCVLMLSLLAASCLADILSSDEHCAGAACDQDSHIELLQRKAYTYSDGEDEFIDRNTKVAQPPPNAGETCTAFQEAYQGLVKVDFALANLVNNNLGGRGPDNGVPTELYFNNAAVVNAAGDMYDLRVTVIGTGRASDLYRPKDSSWNGENGHYGVINVKCGTSVDVEFQLINQATGEPDSLENLVFSWFDLDSGVGGGGDESVTLWPGYSETALPTRSELVQSSVPCPADAGGGECKRFSSSTGGTGKDNPREPMTLTAQQAARTFSVFYKDVSSFRVTLSAVEGNGGRNFLFTGMSEVSYANVDECCPDHICSCKSFCQEQTSLSWEEKCTYAKCSGCDQCDVTTTTTTTQGTASKEEACNSGATLAFDNLVVNTFGQHNGQLMFKNVVEHEGQSLDLIITDAAANYPADNFDEFAPDERGYTGIVKTAARIAVDEAGKYMLRFKLVDSTTGADATLPLFPLVVYDLDGGGEGVLGCNVAGVIAHEETRLTQEFNDPCYRHFATRTEVNIPADFDSLTPRQKKHAVTYIYRNTGVWDIGFDVPQGLRHRYVLFGGSKVMACDYEDKTRDRPWKNKERTADA